MRHAGMSVGSLIDFVNLYREHGNGLEAQKSLIQEQYDHLLAKRNELDKTLNYLSYKLDHFEDHVMPFLDEEEYYEMRKKQMIDNQDENK